MKKLLVVVDFQNDFVDGALGFPGAELLEEPIARKIEAYRTAEDQVIFTFDLHTDDYLKTQEGKNLPVEHCLKGTPGAQLYGCVADMITEADRVFEKPAFGSGDLFRYLAAMQQVADAVGQHPFESIEFVGLVSNICIISNAVLAKAACPEVPIIVDAACTASFDAKLHEESLDVMEGLQIHVINRL